MIEAHPFLFGGALIVSWFSLYRAGFRDAMYITRKKFERGEIVRVANPVHDVGMCAFCDKPPHRGACK